MNKISESVLTVPTIKAINLAPTFDQFFTEETKDFIKNNTCHQLCVEWNRKVGNSKYESPEAYSLGELLDKLGLKNFNDLFASNYVREVSLVRYYGQTAERHNVAEAALRLVNFLNDIVSKKLARAVLAPLTSIELVDGKIVVVSYVAVDKNNEALVQSMYGSLEFQEGECPPEYK